MDAMSMLRRWAANDDFAAVREGCLDLDSRDPGVQVLHALAEVRLGDAPLARRLLDTLERECLDGAAQVDLAAVHMALGEATAASELLESQLLNPLDIDAGTRALLLARLAWCRRREGRRAAAIALFEASLAQQPHITIYLKLIHLFGELDQIDEMAACLSAAQQFFADSQNNWPQNLRIASARRLRAIQLDIWLERDMISAAEYWIENQRDFLDEDDWCRLICDWSRRLLARDRHSQAEDFLRSGLTHCPHNLSLHAELATIAQAQGRARQAIALLDRAIRLAGETSAATDLYWTRLSGIALQIDVSLARHAAELARDELARGVECQWSAPAERRLNVELAIAAVEVHEEGYAAAESRYRAVLAERPQCVPALEALGRLCMQLGRIDEAIALFQSVKDRDAARGYGALINARHFPTDVATLEELETLARIPGVEGSLKTGLMFQLAAAWDKRGDYARAFDLTDEANEASRRLLRYDAAAHRQHCARIRHAFPRTLYENRTGGLGTTVPVFIVGMPRSGTTLVEQILAGHSRVHGAGELGMMPRAIAGLERWERKTGSGRHYPDCVDDLDPEVIHGIAQSLLDELQALGPKAAHICDKLPHNFQNIGLIRLLFPRAKIISVRRDPRDVAISNYFTDYAARHGGMGFAYDLDWIGEQLADHNLLMHHWHQVFPDDLLEIQYETLVADPEAGARQLLDYVGVDWEPQVLEFHTLKRAVKTASLWQVRQPIYASSIQRWRRYEHSLAPLFAATNRRIACTETIEMITLPAPGLLNVGVDEYHEDDLDGAEYRFKQILQHIPGHGAAQFMLGLVYARKGHVDDGIALMVRALERCPWNHEWRRNLTRVYRLHGQVDEALALEEETGAAPDAVPVDPLGQARPAPLRADYLFTSEESTCLST